MAIPGFPITENGGMKGVPDYVDESYGSNGGGIDNVPPPPVKTITNCIDLIKASPNSPYNCDTPGDGLVQPYCKCVNRYEVKAGVMAIVDDTQSGEPTGCN